MTPRHAFSLIEVILAAAILTGALAILGELSRSSLEAARTARLMTEAELLCESKLAEVLAGLVPLESVYDAAFEDLSTSVLDASEPMWLYSIDVAPIDENGLSQLTVTVTQDLLPEQRPASVSLVRYVIDTSMVATTETTSEESTSSTSDTGGSP